MALETATYISDLNSSNPQSSDSVSQADDHLRLLKATVKATFPNVTGAVTVTQAQINDVVNKAPLASPDLTGTPTAPTAASGTNTTQVATTAFVKSAVETERTASATVTNKTISADNNTLSGLAASSFVVSNSSGNIDGSASQKVIPSGAVVGTSDTQTLTNKTVALGSNTVSGTKAQFNTAVTDTDFSFLNDFTGANQSLDTSGFQKLPGGLIIQWGTFTQTSGGYTDVTFPTAFATACVYANVIRLESGDTGGGTVSSIIRSLSTTTASFSVSNGWTYYWFALGY